MSIQDLGSVGELLAGVATSATLFYLAAQIRQNSRHPGMRDGWEGNETWFGPEFRSCIEALIRDTRKDAS